jgi:uncharacterized protein YbaP (TraB family)
MRKIIMVVCLAVLYWPANLMAQPKLYRVAKGDANLYILGGTEVPDTSWFDARIQAALDESSTLWVEIPPADPANGVPALRDEVVPANDRAMHPAAVEAGYGNLALGDYFDVAMGERSVVESQKLNLDGTNFRAMKPWLAYYTFYYAFWDQQNLNLLDPAEELIAKARSANIKVASLFKDRADYYRFMGRMSDFGQTHYFQSLYSIISAQRAGTYASRYTWAQGNPDPQWIEKIRTQTPDYYRYMYQRRNPAIAEQLVAMLAEGGKHFLYVDINRLLGPDSLLLALQALGLDVEDI